MSDYLSDSAYRALCDQLHKEAEQLKRLWYTDPVSGYMVFTKSSHLARGHCCKSGCRHCPYGFTPPNGTTN